MPKATIPLPSREYLREALDYDPETGVLRWRERPPHHFKSDHAFSSWNTRFAGEMAGTPHGNGYSDIRIDYQKMYAHRVVWKWMTGEEPPEQIDHINLDREDNRWRNLRLATDLENRYNKLARKDNRLGVKGVRANVHGTRYSARIGGFHIGSFDTAEEAGEAYRAAARELHGEFHRAG